MTGPQIVSLGSDGGAEVRPDSVFVKVGSIEIVVERERGSNRYSFEFPAPMWWTFAPRPLLRSRRVGGYRPQIAYGDYEKTVEIARKVATCIDAMLSAQTAAREYLRPFVEECAMPDDYEQGYQGRIDSSHVAL